MYQNTIVQLRFAVYLLTIQLQDFVSFLLNESSAQIPTRLPLKFAEDTSAITLHMNLTHV